MNTFTMFDYIAQKQVETTFEAFTGLKIGDLVVHANAGKSAGSFGIISSQQGTIKGFQDQGEHHFGGRCITVDVVWSDGTKNSMVHNLVKLVSK